jgi:VanZ family protein
LKKKYKDFLRILPAVGYFLIIWNFSAHPIPFDIGGSDKVIHILEYSFMGFLVAFGYKLTPETYQNQGKTTFITACLTGIVDEIHQYFVPGRSCNFFDFMADMAGCAIGIIFYVYLLKLLTNVRSWNYKDAPE